MASIDDFKSNLIGGGARANQYRVIMSTPSGIATGLDTVRTQYLVKATSLPGQTIPEVTVLGDSMKVGKSCRDGPQLASPD